MTQQAQNEYYPSDGDLAMAYAGAVNEEVRDLFAAGADIVQLDEPYVQARPEAARDYAVPAIDRALEGATGRTALHVCFGYGKHVKDKPDGYAFLEELNECAVEEVSLECAQPKLKMDLLSLLPDKTVHVGVLDLRDTERRIAARCGGSHSCGTRGDSRGADDRGARLRHEIPPEGCGLRKDAQHGAGSGPGVG